MPKMCVRPTHTCLFIGMLMPAMRAMVLTVPKSPRLQGAGSRGKNAVVYWKYSTNHLLKPGLALSLLVARVRANDVDHAPAAHDLAVLADLLDRRTNFHVYPPEPVLP